MLQFFQTSAGAPHTRIKPCLLLFNTKPQQHKRKLGCPQTRNARVAGSLKRCANRNQVSSGYLAMDWLTMANLKTIPPVQTRSLPVCIGRQAQSLRRRCHKVRQQQHVKQAATCKAKSPAVNLVPEAKQSQTKGSCYGCGTDLQTLQPGTAGYVAPDKYAVKLQFKQLNLLVCERCQALSHGQMVPAVQDFTAQGKQLAGKSLVSPAELRAQLKGLSEKRVLALLVVDLLDCSGSFLNHVRDLVGRNPIMLVGTKMDLMPTGTDPKAIVAWLRATASYRRLNVVHTFVVGSPKGQGIGQVASAVLSERKGRDVYVLGAANVGKSSFVRALVREMSSGTSRCFQAPAKAQSKQLPVESAMPGTTLKTIQLQTFGSGGALYDTPGVHLHHRLPHMLTPAELKQLRPLKRLLPYFPPSPAAVTFTQETETNPGSIPRPSASRSVSATYQWGALVRLDVISAPYGTGLAFVGPPTLSVHALPLLQPDEHVESAAPPHTSSSASQASHMGQQVTTHIGADSPKPKPSSYSASTSSHVGQPTTTHNSAASTKPHPSSSSTPNTYSLVVNDVVSRAAAQDSSELTDDWQRHLARLKVPNTDADALTSIPSQESIPAQHNGTSGQTSEATQSVEASQWHRNTAQSQGALPPSQGSGVHHVGTDAGQVGGAPPEGSQDQNSPAAQSGAALLESSVASVANSSAQQQQQQNQQQQSQQEQQQQQQQHMGSGLSQLQGSGLPSGQSGQKSHTMQQAMHDEERGDGMGQQEEEERLFAEESVRARGGLHMVEKVIKVSAVPGAVSDIAISGLPAWITLLSPGKSGNVHVKVWVPKGVEVFVRPAIPIAGLDRYEPDPEWPVAM